MSFNILLLGSGGREHALAWKISQSPLCRQLFVAPGNAGTADCGDNVPFGAGDFSHMEQLVTERDIRMLVVGPEEPLVNGIYDYFQSKEQFRQVMVIGPGKEAAKLEGSKSYAKQFMFRHGIPTAAYREFDAPTLPAGLDHIENSPGPYVLKADGLAGGKGVLIIASAAEAKQELTEMIAHAKFGKASGKVVIEQFLSGIEFSVFVLTDGHSYKVMPEAKDYKRIGEGDSGLNTGGMGAVSPVPFYDRALRDKVEERIIKPTIAGLEKEGLVYKGFLFFGLIVCNGEPYVIEYNCRLGDPETEVVLPRLESDLVQHLFALSTGTLESEDLIFSQRTAATVVVASGGYPGDYEKYKPIKGIPLPGADSIVFHAGTKNSGHDIVTNGGRVLAVTSYGSNIAEAVSRSNQVIAQIRFDKKYYRKDIGYEFIY